MSSLILNAVNADPFATKGAEYILVVGFLICLLLFWRVLNRPAVAAVRRADARAAGRWFRLPGHLRYHPGHAWAASEGGGIWRVGLDDFAQKLLGEPQAACLPRPGTRLEQGTRGWQMQVSGKSIDVLSPLNGEVIDVNEAAERTPAVVNDDPYGHGWLLRVRVTDALSGVKNLFGGGQARAWMDRIEDTLRFRVSEQLGYVLQDGGTPVSGIARELSPEQWDAVVREFFLTNEMGRAIETSPPEARNEDVPATPPRPVTRDET